MNPLLELMLALAAVPRRPQKWGRAGTPPRLRKSRTQWRDLSLLHPAMNVRKRMRLANQDRVYGWMGRMRLRSSKMRGWHWHLQPQNRRIV